MQILTNMIYRILSKLNNQSINHTVDTPWLDGAHVVFGKVVDGLDVVDAIEGIGSQSGATSAPVMIKACGEIE